MFTLLAAVALAGANPGTSAVAHEDYTTVEGRVSLEGLDLSNPADVAELKERIALKAINICRRGASRELWESRSVRNCIASVISDGKAKLAALVQSGHALAEAKIRD